MCVRVLICLFLAALSSSFFVFVALYLFCRWEGQNFISIWSRRKMPFRKHTNSLWTSLHNLYESLCMQVSLKCTLPYTYKRNYFWTQKSWGIEMIFDYWICCYTTNAPKADNAANVEINKSFFSLRRFTKSTKWIPEIINNNFVLCIWFYCPFLVRKRNDKLPLFQFSGFFRFSI